MLPKRTIALLFLLNSIVSACSKDSSTNVTPPPPLPPANFTLAHWSVGGIDSKFETVDVNTSGTIKLKFLAPIDRATVAAGIALSTASGAAVNYNATYENADSTVIVKPAQTFAHLTRYRVTVSPQLKSVKGGTLNTSSQIDFFTSIDSSRKFPALSDNALLTLVQKQTFKYFYDFGHPTSGLARERNTSGDLVTSGGSGFGIMALVTGVDRSFITRAEGLARMQKIVGFLKNTAQRFHGVYPHWLDGNTGAVIPFSAKDDGADLVETSFLMQGLLTARQYFSGASAAETALRNDINTIYNGVEWEWFRKDNEDVLYWHWSPNFGWDMNHQIRGWNETLITYVMAAASPTHSIPKTVYDNGFALNGAMKNGNSYYGVQLPLGPAGGGPLFFSHYSFLGINPNGLSDSYANYFTQNKNHSLINYNYCVANPNNNFGYSDSVWGLTASDIRNGYTASSPTNDVGVIAPTAALSSFPYTPNESMKALKFYYYVLGDKLLKEYGFIDAFSLKEPWFADSFLAIDQGPIIVMIENYRTGLLWNLFTSCPEVKSGMKKLGFQSPYL